MDQMFTLKQLSLKARQKVYGIVKREALRRVMRMCDVGGKLLSCIRSIYVNILAGIRNKKGLGES